MKKADRKERVQEIIMAIDRFLAERNDSHERSIEDLAQIEMYIAGCIDRLREDIKRRKT